MSGERILVATDGSNDAGRAVDWLADFQLPADAAVEVVNAIRLPFPMDQIIALGWQEFLAESERVVAEARRRLEKRWPTWPDACSRATRARSSSTPRPKPTLI